MVNRRTKRKKMRKQRGGELEPSKFSRAQTMTKKAAKKALKVATNPTGVQPGDAVVFGKSKPRSHRSSALDEIIQGENKRQEEELSAAMDANLKDAASRNSRLGLTPEQGA